MLDLTPTFVRLYVTKLRSIAEIAAEYRVSYWQVRQALISRDIILRDPQPRREARPATPEMIGDYARMALVAVAKKHRVDREVMRRRLILAGVTIRTPGRPAKRRAETEGGGMPDVR